MKLHCRTAISEALGPTRRSFCRLNSVPSENISRITPSSDSVRTMSRFGRQRNRHVRADDHASQHIPQHDGLAQPLKDDRRHGRRAKDNRQGFQKQELFVVVHAVFIVRVQAGFGDRSR